MPRTLRHPPPSSSIARLLDLDAAARAVATRPAAEVPTVSPALRSPPVALPTASSERERPTLDRQLVLTPSTDETLSRLVDLYRRATGTRATSSHIARAVLRGVAHCMEHLEREARRLGRMRLPSNARGRELERERFEARIADAFVSGIRAAPAFHDGEPDAGAVR